MFVLYCSGLISNWNKLLTVNTLQNSQTGYPKSDLHANYLSPQPTDLTLWINHKANTPHQSLSSKLTWVVYKVIYCSSSETLSRWVTLAWKKNCYASKHFFGASLCMLLSFPLNELNFYSHFCLFHMFIKKEKNHKYYSGAMTG